ncbi:MAG: glutamate racemase [Candidatus Dadabacteria bacterium]|nr:glutamate racemase [Candidatus Dadabacteria bacterium]
MQKGKKNEAIGIFDSGIGGLTVSKEIINLLSGEDIVYLGDTARVPYGTKSGRTVRKYVESTTNFLLSKNIKLLVVACNTASAYAIEMLKETLEIPIVGVVEPGAKRASELTINGKIGVIGTQATIKSGSYEKKLRDICSSPIKIYSKSCPLFVPLAEEGWENEETSALIAEKYLGELRESGIDVLILGCTHYPLLKNTIAGVMGKGIRLVDSAEETAKQTENILRSQGLLRKDGKAQQMSFYLTDDSETFTSIASRFLGRPMEKTEVVDIV